MHILWQRVEWSQVRVVLDWIGWWGWVECLPVFPRRPKTIKFEYENSENNIFSTININCFAYKGNRASQIAYNAPFYFSPNLHIAYFVECLEHYSSKCTIMQLLLLFSHRQRYRHRRRCSCRLTTVRSRACRSQTSDTARWAEREKG